MIFRDDVEDALGTLVELVNTLPECGGSDLLPDTPALRGFVERQGTPPAHVTDSDTMSVRRLRRALLDVIDAANDAQAVGLLNGVLAHHPHNTQLAAHDGTSWHLHHSATGASAAEHLAVDCTLALAQVIADGGRDRLARCAAPDCQRVLVDLSRNHSKRYCDARTCGNRLHVAAYRERQRARA